MKNQTNNTEKVDGTLQREDLYTVFKICLLLKDMSTKDFADKHTGTSPQHVTMVAKGDKESVPVRSKINAFIDETTKDPRTQEFLRTIVNHGRQAENGKEAEKGAEYDW